MVKHAIGIDECVVVTEYNNGDHHFQFSDSHAEESIAKLEAVAMALPSMVMPLNSNINGNIVDGNVVDGNSIWSRGDADSTRSTLATTLLSADLEDDDDFEEDDFDEDDSIIPCYSPLRYPCTTNMSRNGYMSGGGAYQKPNYYSEPYPQQNCSRTRTMVHNMVTDRFQ